MKDKIKVKQGKTSRATGQRFELLVRKDLESMGFICDKWTNNVENNKLVPAKPKFLFINGGMRMVGNSSGFPDFIAFTHEQIKIDTLNLLEQEIVDGDIPTIIGVESKMTGELDRQEKEKCKWLLDNKVFSKILIAEKTKVKNRVVIVYHDFKTKYYRFYK